MLFRRVLIKFAAVDFVILALQLLLTLANLHQTQYESKGVIFFLKKKTPDLLLSISYSRCTIVFFCI